MTRGLQEYRKMVIAQAKAYYKEPELLETDSPRILVTPLPEHIRSKKLVTDFFKVIMLDDVPDGTLVTLKAGNKNVHCCRLQDNEVEMEDGVAIFYDLRFIDYSGRGCDFQITIQIHLPVPEVVTYPGKIKITADGPREKRYQPKPKPNNSRTPLLLFPSGPLFSPFIQDKNYISAYLLNSGVNIQPAPSPAMPNFLQPSAFRPYNPLAHLPLYSFVGPQSEPAIPNGFFYNRRASDLQSLSSGRTSSGSEDSDQCERVSNRSPYTVFPLADKRPVPSPLAVDRENRPPSSPGTRNALKAPRTRTQKSNKQIRLTSAPISKTQVQERPAAEVKKTVAKKFNIWRPI